MFLTGLFMLSKYMNFKQTYVSPPCVCENYNK